VNDKDMKQLLQTAAATAKAHRDAVRLLLQGIDDALHADVRALFEFLGEPVNHDVLTEVDALTSASQVFLHPIQHITVDAIAEHVRRSSNWDLAIKKYQSIADEARERVTQTCPCRECVRDRDRAVKSVNACLWKIQKERTDEKDSF
jgi:hypothetical protein